LAALGAFVASAAGPATPMPQEIAASRVTACSKAVARKLIDANDLNGFSLPPAEVLCGPFTGPRSRAMVVTVAAPTCWGEQHWAVFDFRGGTWTLVFQQAAFIFPPVVALGSDIRVETAVFLSSDKARCLPNGGSQARTWHWNGKTFIPGTPTQIKPATPPKLLEAHFYSPGRQVGCDMIDNPAPQQNHPAVFCSNNGSTRTAYLTTDRPLVTCRSVGCMGVGGIGGKILGYAKEITVGRFRCRVAATGVTCVVTATGKGFVISATTVKPISP
jgi:hypothetical protein